MTKMQSFVLAAAILTLCQLTKKVAGETGISPETMAACSGEVVITRSQGLILSPNFPREYEADSSCNWTLLAPPRHMIEMSFYAFHLEESSSCRFDSVKIYHEGVLFTGVGYCGRFAPRDFSSVSNMITVIFESDASTNEGGFIIGWRFKESCVEGEFSCWSGYCIPKRKQCDSDIDCPDGSDEIECAHATDDNVEECGVQAESPRFPWQSLTSGRIVQGSTAAPGSWPWQARLRRTTDYRGVCGASVINTLVLITAGHCVDDNKVPTDFAIQVGLLNMSDPLWYKQLHELKTFVLHPRYIKKNFRNDIAVLILKKKLVYSKYVRPICLIDVENRDFEFVHPERCVITGYGDIDHTSGKIYPNDIYQARLPVRAQEECVAAYNRINIPVTDLQVCAGEGDGDACQGDSGGPLSCLHRDNFRWFQIGATSFGVQCSDSRFPGVYSRISAYYKWIKTELRWAEACSSVHYLTGMNSSSEAGSITSPNYPENYFHNLNCRWTMLLPRNRVVKIDFMRFNMGDVCFRSSGDALEIYSDGQRIVRLCGSRSPEYMTSDATNVTVYFRSDDSFSGSGFMFSWRVLKTQDVLIPNAVSGIINHQFRATYEVYARVYRDLLTTEYRKLVTNGCQKLQISLFLVVLLIFLYANKI